MASDVPSSGASLVAGIRKRRLLPIVFLTAAVGGMPAWLLASGTTYGGHDLIGYSIPHAERERQDFRNHGEFPLWDFYQYGGTPVAGGFQAEILYPPNVLLLLVPSAKAFPILFALHLAAACFGMYRLARSYSLGRGAATLGALCYTLSFTLTARLAAGHYSPFVTMGHAPLVLFLLRRLMKDPRGERALILGLYGGMVFLYGHPQFVYHLGCLTATFAAFEALQARREKKPLGRRLGLLGAAGALSVLIASASWLPALEVRSHAVRGETQADEVYKEVPPDFSFIPADGLTFLIPLLPRSHYVRGEGWTGFWHEKAVYLGILPLVCAAYSLLRRRSGSPVLFLWGVVIFVLLESSARGLPLHNLCTRILPGYGTFRVPARSLWLSVMALSLLAAIGWDRFVKDPETDHRRLFVPAGVAFGALLLGTVLCVGFGVRGEILVFVGIAIAAAAVFFLARRDPARGAAAAALLTGVELLGQVWAVVPVVRPDQLTPVPWYRSGLGSAPSEYRVLDSSDARYGPATHGVRMMNGYGYPLLSDMQQLYSSAWEPQVPINFNTLGEGTKIVKPEILDLLNVGWLVWEGNPPEQGLLEMARAGGKALYRRPSARPWVSARTGTVQVVARENSLEARVRLREAEEILVSESWMPGWRARVDGRPVEVRKHANALLGIPVPAGDHEVRVWYRPRAVVAGLWISALALGAGFLLLVWVRVSIARRRAPPVQ
jgi:membrane protein YfhO